MTIDELQSIPGLTLMGEEDDLREQETGFRIQASVPSCDGMFSSQVEIEVRCPRVNNLILLNQATVYRADGEEPPLEFQPSHLSKTLSLISRSHQSASLNRDIQSSNQALSSKDQQSSKARQALRTAAAILAPEGLASFLSHCGEAYQEAVEQFT